MEELLGIESKLRASVSELETRISSAEKQKMELNTILSQYGDSNSTLNYEKEQLNNGITRLQTDLDSARKKQISELEGYKSKNFTTKQ